MDNNVNISRISEEEDSNLREDKRGYYLDAKGRGRKTPEPLGNPPRTGLETGNKFVGCRCN